jgi:hypothetical protein
MVSIPQSMVTASVHDPHRLICMCELGSMAGPICIYSTGYYTCNALDFYSDQEAFWPVCFAIIYAFGYCIDE